MFQNPCEIGLSPYSGVQMKRDKVCFVSVNDHFQMHDTLAKRDVKSTNFFSIVCIHMRTFSMSFETVQKHRRYHNQNLFRKSPCCYTQYAECDLNKTSKTLTETLTALFLMA